MIISFRKSFPQRQNYFKVFIHHSIEPQGTHALIKIEEAEG
jgi:hypothetical protein